MNDIVKRETNSVKERIKITVEEILPLVKKEIHFAVIEGRIEPTRDLALMLFDSFNLSVDSDLQKDDGNEIIVKATAWTADGRKASGLGMCSRAEKKGKHAAHDALGTAETRAMKRAIEALAGGPVINQLIQHFFGGFDAAPEKPRNVTPSPQDYNGNGGKKKDPDRQPIIDFIANLMKHECITDTDRETCKQQIKKAKTVYALEEIKIQWRKIIDERVGF